MAFFLNRRPRPTFIAITAAGCAALAGCGEADQIRSYTVPKETKVEVAATSPNAKPGEPTDRMLAAILPAEPQAWFFKVVGPIADVAKHEKEIRDFFAGLMLSADGRAHWKVPSGWKEEPGDGFREATIVIPGDKPLQITVNKASWSGSTESKLANVNRWRGQLQLPSIGAQELGQVSHETKAGDRTMTIVDMKGQFKAGGMTPPFAGGAMGPSATGSRARGPNQSAELPSGHPPIDSTSDLPAGHPPLDANLPAGHPPIGRAAQQGTGAQQSETKADSNDIPKFNAPSSWKQEPASGMSKVDFVISDGQQKARVRIIPFRNSEGQMIGDPLSNINRWRGEVGLEPIQRDKLASVSETIQIDGKPATFAAMIPEAGKGDQSKDAPATLAAMAHSDGQIWFIKMMGSRDLVAARKDEFKAFLKTLKFPTEGGAVDGNK